LNKTNKSLDLNKTQSRVSINHRISFTHLCFKW